MVYYDTYESMEAMLKEELAASVLVQREELQKLQQKARQLEARRGRVSAKKAYLRNKKVCTPRAPGAPQAWVGHLGHAPVLCGEAGEAGSAV